MTKQEFEEITGYKLTDNLTYKGNMVINSEKFTGFPVGFNHLNGYLTIDNVPAFTGENFTYSGSDLRIYNCPAFTGENFTYSGSYLTIYNCPAFTG
jgi:hypothetical protein